MVCFMKYILGNLNILNKILTITRVRLQKGKKSKNVLPKTYFFNIIKYV